MARWVEARSRVVADVSGERRAGRHPARDGELLGPRSGADLEDSVRRELPVRGALHRAPVAAGHLVLNRRRRGEIRPRDPGPVGALPHRQPRQAPGAELGVAAGEVERLSRGRVRRHVDHERQSRLPRLLREVPVRDREPGGEVFVRDGDGDGERLPRRIEALHRGLPQLDAEVELDALGHGGLAEEVVRRPLAAEGDSAPGTARDLRPRARSPSRACPPAPAPRAGRAAAARSRKRERARGGAACRAERPSRGSWRRGQYRRLCGDPTPRSDAIQGWDERVVWKPLPPGQSARGLRVEGQR